MKTKNIVVTGLLAAVICVLAPWSVPIGPVPLSLATFAVYITAAVSRRGQGALAVLCYILLGAVGLPVFAGFAGGAGRIAGVTGGYIVGYLPCALIIGALVGRFEDKKWAYPLSMLAGTAALYAFGTAWYMLQTQAALSAALAMCVLPFLPLDALKIAAASLAAYPVRRRLRAYF